MDSAQNKENETKQQNFVGESRKKKPFAKSLREWRYLILRLILGKMVEKMLSELKWSKKDYTSGLTWWRYWNFGLYDATKFLKQSYKVK